MIENQALALQARWVHPHKVERWLRRSCIGRTLNVCCGMSLVGDVRIDTDWRSNRTEAGDLFSLTFENQSFDTVICDPPFSYYNRFSWIAKIRDIARKRVLISSPATNIRMMFSRRNWNFALYAVGDHGSPMLRLYWCFDRCNGFIEVI